MALTIRKFEMPREKYAIKCPYTMTPEYVVIHNTANDAPAENEIRYMQQNDAYTSFHYAVDDKEAVQGVDISRNAWHAGDGSNGPGNRKGIAIEICYSRSGGARFEKAEKNAAELTAKLLIDFGWDISKVTKHQDYSGKYCPHRTLDMGWQRFLDMVEARRKELLGIKTNAKTGRVTLNGYTIEECKNFSILYWDKGKKKGTAASYINGGFFAYYKEGNLNFTLPVGNLVCDVTQESSLKYAVEKYWKPYISAGKFRYGTKNNAAAQFRGKAVTTFVVGQDGRPFITETSAPPAGCRYAISGIPVIRDGVDVSYSGFVRPQGWDASPFYATSRNFIGIKGSTIYIVSGVSKTENFVATSEAYNALESFGFEQLLTLDGGTSFYHKYKGKSDLIWTDREINNIITY